MKREKEMVLLLFSKWLNSEHQEMLYLIRSVGQTIWILPCMSLLPSENTFNYLYFTSLINKIKVQEGWVLKNWLFWIVVLKKTIESPLDCKEINQSILKEINPEYSLEGLMLKLKLWHFGHLMQSWFTEKDSDAGKDWRHKGKGVAEMRWDEMAEMRWLDSITDSMDMNLNKCQELVEDRGAWRVTVHGSERFGYDWAIEQQQQQLSNKDSGQRILLLSMRQLWHNKKQLTLFPKDNTYT